MIALRGEFRDRETITVEMRDDFNRPVMGPDGPFRVRLHGPKSKAMTALRDAELDERALRMRSRGAQAVTQRDARDLSYEVYAKAHISWENVPVADGEPQPDCTEENARALLEDYSWYFEQIDAALYDKGNFRGEG